MFWDTHCHLFKEYYEDIDKIIDLAKKNGVKGMIVAGCSHKSNQEVISLLNRENIYGVLGIHPEEEVCSDEELDFMENNLLNSKIVGIGEIGLDYHYDTFSKETQKYWFEKQLEIAKLFHTPVIIHSREAAQDCFDIICKSGVNKGVIHCYSGSPEMAEEYIKMGFYIGMGGVLTFPNAKKLVEVAKKIPLERILIETDCPYLAPVPYRGKRNDSRNLEFVVKKLAEIKGLSPSEVANITLKNGENLFFL